MNKQKIITSLLDLGVVAVVRAENSEQAIQIANACLEGGLHAIEITYTVPNASKVILDLAETFKDQGLIIGAGTVLDSETARNAILAGAQYIVSPSFNFETAKLCNRYQIPYMPGCMTITEMVTALEAGVDIIKLFPGAVFGPSYVKAVKAPLPQINIMPTGGVNLNNIGEWFNNGVCAVGVGGDLFSSAKDGDYETITVKAKAYVEAVKNARKNIK